MCMNLPQSHKPTPTTQETQTMKTNRSRIRTLVPQCAAILAVAAAVLFAGAAAHGALIAEETFDYSTGTLQDKNGGTGWGGAWGKIDDNLSGDVTSPGMTHPSLIDTGTNKASINATSDDNARPQRDFASGIAADGVWVSFIGQMNDKLGRASVIQFSDTIGNAIAKIGRPNDNTGDGNWGITEASLNEPGELVEAVDESGDGLSTTTKALVVANFTQSGNDWTLDLYLNPDSSGPSSATHSGTRTFTDSNVTGDLGNVVFFVGGDNTSLAEGPSEFDFDDLRVGESFSDVVVIPEPTTLALLALGGVAALLRRRRA